MTDCSVVPVSSPSQSSPMIRCSKAIDERVAVFMKIDFFFVLSVALAVSERKMKNEIFCCRQEVVSPRPS